MGGSRRQPGPYDVEHLPSRGEHAQGTPGPAIDYGRSIDEDLEFAVATANHLDLDSQLAAQPGRHPGGMQPGDSVGTIPNSDPTHDDLQRILAWLGLAPEDLPDAPPVPFGSPVGIISDEWCVKPCAALLDAALPVV